MRINDQENQTARRWGAARLLLIFIFGLLGGIFLCLAAIFTVSRVKPSLPIPASAESTPLPTADIKDLLNINRATREELDALPGIGPSLAKAIMNFREENGGFHFIEELMDVPGIGEKKFQAIRDLICCSSAENP